MLLYIYIYIYFFFLCGEGPGRGGGHVLKMYADGGPETSHFIGVALAKKMLPTIII